MGVRVEEEWRYKRIRSERAAKSAFSYKINSNLKLKAQESFGFSPKGHYSREVMVKITAGATHKKGIGNAIQYISKNWRTEITDSNGLKYSSKEEIKDAAGQLIDILSSDRYIHKGIGLKRLRGDFWEARKGIKVRILFRWEGELVEFVLAGNHDDIKRFLKNI